MLSRNDRRRRVIQIESLEGRNAPSRFGALSAKLAEMHHNRHHKPAGQHQQVSTLRRGGLDDPANHNQNDDRGTHRGLDDPANHDQNDDRGNHRANDDPANHDQNDDRGGHGRGHR